MTENRNLTLGSLFDGSGGFPLAGLMAGIEPVWSSEIEPFPVLVTHKRLPKVKHYGDVSRLSGAELEPVDIITFGSPCFPEGTLVLTEQGYLPIEDVEVGTKVLTHKGRWRTVTATGAKFGETVILKGNHYGLECTPNHPIYSSGERKYYPQLGNGKRGNQLLLTGEKAWVPAEEMKGRLWAVPNSAESLPIAAPVYSGSWRQKAMPPVSVDLFYFIGRWLGDGWVRNGQRPGRAEGQRYGMILLCDSLDKEDELRRAVERITENYHVEHQRTVVKFKFTSQVLCDWLTDNFGQYAHGKTMPGWVFGLAYEYRQALLNGLLDSDGSRVKGKDSTWRISTVSKRLAESIRILAEIQGYSTTVFRTVVSKTGMIEGRVVNQRDVYEVKITKSDRRVHLTDERHGWYRVRSVSCTNRTKVVYNLTVDEDNSYVADGIVVHNCQDLSIAGKRAGIQEGERSSLFFQAIRIIREMRKKTNGEKPKFCVWENVPGAFSSHGGEDFRAVLEAVIGIKEEGVQVPAPENHRWPKADVYLGDGWSVAYRVFDAQYWGTPQRRSRIYLVADFAGERAGEILFKSEGVSGYSKARCCAWQGAAGGAEKGTGASGAEPGAYCLNPQGNSGVGVTHERTSALVAQDHGNHPAVLQAAGFCTEHSAKARSIGYEEEKSPTLRAGVVPAALELYENHAQDSRFRGPLEVAQPVTANYGMGGNNQPFIVKPEPVTLKIRSGCEGGGKGALWQENKSATLGTHNDQTLFQPCPEGRETYDVRFTSNGTKNARGHCYPTDISRCLDTGGEDPDSNHGGICVVEPAPIAFAQNQRDEVRDLKGRSGALSAQPGAKQQTYVLQGSMIGRADKNGPQGAGINEDVSFTLNTTDRHAVAAPKEEPTYCATTGNYMTVYREQTSTLLARDWKDPQIVNDAPNDEPVYIVRRLTPVECARLQGFPDWWCSDLAIPDPTDEQLAFWTEVWATWNTLNGRKPKTEKQVRKWLADPYSDSAEYKLWGNGIFAGNAFFVLAGIVWAANQNKSD